ncbi:MAG: nucleotide exchange factor GrpE [Prolixibacteraceae bacterium]|jgi:molecular chaperone GrpE|nr:nucleotide exchange factor GrpE [Prolixibacteraceae bacterium]
MTKKKEEHNKNTRDSMHSPESQIASETSSQEQSGHIAEEEIVSKETELEYKVAELTAGLAASSDKYLRLSAEFDNFRKRTLKEKMDLMKNASESVIVSFLPVIDDVERAIKAIETSDNLETIKEGINLIYNKFKDFTKQNGVVEMEANGLELNTDHHEAITKIPAPSEDLKGKIVEVVQKGYMLNDKVIRYAKVVIGE